uniref:cilia- and flagella-associated protein 263 n=1 Tax=Semicossyphus pulcher TaxID=241346 RepID=UPI0037E8354F
MEEKGNAVTKEQKELLYNRVQELKRSNAALLAEIDLFEWFIGRIDPQHLVSQAGAGAPGASQLEGGGRGRRRKSRSHTSERLQQLTLKQKLYMAQREVMETQQDHEKLTQRYERTQDHYKASLQEAEMRLSEVRKAQREFEHRLLKPLKDNRWGVKEPEKVLQYIEDKSKVTQFEKLHLKNQALKVQEKKLQQQLQQKIEAGKAVEYKVEHSFLKVYPEEEVFQEFDEQRFNKNVVERQVNNLTVQQVLTSQKEKLQSVTQESTELSNDITNRKQILANIEEKIQHAQEELSKAETLNQHLNRQITDYHAPGIIEYVHVKDKHKKLQQSIHTWERRVGISEMALKAHSKAWNTQRATLTPANSADAGARSGQHRIPVKLPHIPEHST